MLHLDIDTAGIARAARDIGATAQQAQRALDSTLGRMATWLRAKSMRELAPHLKVQQKVLRRRLKSFRLKRNADGSEITVWYGLDNIALIHLGARQTRQGVSAGPHRRPGAFIARGRGGNRQVFKRTGSARLPIEKQTLPIQDDAQKFIEDNLLGSAEFNERFFTLFERELTWRTRAQR